MPTIRQQRVPENHRLITLHDAFKAAWDSLIGEFKSEVQRAREEEVGIELRHWLDWVYENKHSILPGDSVDAVPAYYSV